MPARPAKAIIDTDIGGDIDDAFAVAESGAADSGYFDCEGDTTGSARILDPMLGYSGRSDIPVGRRKH
jgi:hypothetical protein